METALIVTALAAAFTTGTGLLIAALGEGYAERAGVMNLGIEGIMLAAAFFGFWTALQVGLVAGLLVALIIGMALAAVHGIASVILRANQFISGLAIWVIGLGLSSFLDETLLKSPPLPNYRIPYLSVPGLSNLPVLGPILFSQNVLVYVALLMVPVLHYILYHTRAGLNVRAVGDNPKAADAMGVNVRRVRMVAVIFSGLMFGLAGYYYSVFLVGTFGIDMTAGRGWIAIVIAFFGKWDPKRILAGALLFGGADALQLRLQVQSSIPGALLAMVPYVLSIAAVTVISRRGGTPASLGIPYKRGD